MQVCVCGLCVYVCEGLTLGGSVDESVSTRTGLKCHSPSHTTTLPLPHTYPHALQHTGRAAECESLYRQALCLCPTYPSAHYNLGVLASEGRRWLDALQHYKDTLALAPHHAQVGGMLSFSRCDGSGMHAMDTRM